MSSGKLRRDWAPEPDVIESLDKVPLMKRSRVLNQAVREYFDKHRAAEFQRDVLKRLDGIEALLEKLLKRK